MKSKESLRLLLACMERDVESARAWIAFFMHRGDAKSVRDHEERLQDCKELRDQALEVLNARCVEDATRLH